MFKDYLITNVLLWIDQYESVISPEVGDVTTPEYEKQKADMARFNKGGEAAPAPAPAETPEQAALSEQILKRLKQLNIV